MDQQTNDMIKNEIDNNEVCLFMKGTPEAPQCGFSNRAAQVLNQLSHPYASVNILTDRMAIPAVCQWSDFPTMPQVFVGGELIGGSDIALEMLQSGELKSMLVEAREARGMPGEWDTES